MRATASHPVLRWSAPVVAAAAAITGAQIAVHHSASAAPQLPQRTAHQLLTELLSAHPAGMSGTVQESADLGLPQLPTGGTGGAEGPGSGSGAAGSLALLTGSHTMRVWYAAPDKTRIAVLADGSETDLVTDGTQAWLWNSADRSVQHLSRGSIAQHKLPAHDHAIPTGPGSAAAMTPGGMATWALGMLKPSTRVSVASNVTVAGRAAYQLTLTPKTPNTRIGSVRIAVDAAQHVPLRTQVFAKGHSTPAINVGFSSVSFTVPPASRFRFTPPPGSHVQQVRPPARQHHRAVGPEPGSRVVGTGWSSVLVATLPKGASGHAGSRMALPPDALRMLPKVSGSWGSGHLLSSTLFSAVVTNDGRVAIGAVPPSQLYAALGRG